MSLKALCLLDRDRKLYIRQGFQASNRYCSHEEQSLGCDSLIASRYLRSIEQFQSHLCIQRKRSLRHHSVFQSARIVRMGKQFPRRAVKTVAESLSTQNWRRRERRKRDCCGNGKQEVRDRYAWSKHIGHVLPVDELDVDLLKFDLI